MQIFKEKKQSQPNSGTDSSIDTLFNKEKPQAEESLDTIEAALETEKERRREQIRRQKEEEEASSKRCGCW